MLIFDLGCGFPLKLWEFDLRRAVMPPKRGTCTAIFSEEITISELYQLASCVFGFLLICHCCRSFLCSDKTTRGDQKIVFWFNNFNDKEVQSFLKEVKHTLRT